MKKNELDCINKYEMAIVPGDKSLPLLVSLLNHILCKGFVFRLVIEGKLVDRLAIWNLKA